jgi:hypothetical protein
MHDALLIGSNLALLTAACALGRSGRKVVLLTEAGRLGGYFAGVHVESHGFDLGMVFLERPGDTHAMPDLAEYDARVRNDCGRFSAHVAQFVESLVRTRRVPTPEALVAGKRFPDYILCNRIEAIASLVTDAPRTAADAGVSHPLHARNKVAGPAYDQVSYLEAAQHNHGVQAQALLFEPFAAKVLGPHRQLLARFHRSPWLPLYYPETIVDACDGRSTALPEYAFWLPEEGWCGAFVAAMVAELTSMPHVQVVPQAVAGLDKSGAAWALHTADGDRFESTTLALGTTQERARQLFRLPPPRPSADSVSVRLGLFLVDETAMHAPTGCLIVTDPAYATYRLTDLDAAAGVATRWHRVVLEQGTARVSEMDAELRSLLQIDDSRAVRPLKTIDASRSLVVPSAEGLSTAQADLEQLRGAVSNVHLTAALAAVGGASMNDQIIQGLKLAQLVAMEA